MISNHLFEPTLNNNPPRQFFDDKILLKKKLARGNEMLTEQIIVVVVLHIYPSVTGQRQTLAIVRSTTFEFELRGLGTLVDMYC